MKIKKAEFMLSNTDVAKCPKPDKPEYAFIGRSNVGKSSLINMLTERNKLAKISGRPGKTQHINHFNINDEWYLVDLPGYGYAKVSKTQRSKFGDIIQEYLLNRDNLYCLMVLIDSRLPAQPIDLEFLQWLGVEGIPFVLVFTKADKQSPNKTQSNIAAFRREFLKTWEQMPQYFVTSAVDGRGKEKLLDFIDSLNQESVK